MSRASASRRKPEHVEAFEGSLRNSEVPVTSHPSDPREPALLADLPSKPTLVPGVLPRHLHVSLVAAHAVGFATLIRSVAFDRWITVLASLLLVAGATAALRGRTWGVILAFASATAFPVAWAIGIAPLWFVFVGLLGALPYMLVSGALAQIDKKAARWLTALAAGAGALGAIGWKLVAWDVFAAFPSLRPSAFPQHGAAVLALLGAGMVAMLVASRTKRIESVRIDGTEPVRHRIAVDVGSTSSTEAAEAEAEAVDEAKASRERRH
jgi:hypothetical protein